MSMLKRVIGFGVCVYVVYGTFKLSSIFQMNLAQTPVSD